MYFVWDTMHETSVNRLTIPERQQLTQEVTWCVIFRRESPLTEPRYLTSSDENAFVFFTANVKQYRLVKHGNSQCLLHTHFFPVATSKFTKVEVNTMQRFEFALRLEANFLFIHWMEVNGKWILPLSSLGFRFLVSLLTGTLKLKGTTVFWVWQIKIFTVKKACYLVLAESCPCLSDLIKSSGSDLNLPINSVLFWNMCI